MMSYGRNYAATSNRISGTRTVTASTAAARPATASSVRANMSMSSRALPACRPGSNISYGASSTFLPTSSSQGRVVSVGQAASPLTYPTTFSSSRVGTSPTSVRSSPGAVGQSFTTVGPGMAMRPAAVLPGASGVAGLSSAAFASPAMSASCYAPSSLAPRVVQISQAPARAPAQVSAQVVPLGGPTASKGAHESKHRDDAQLSNLKKLKKACGLKSVPVKAAAAAFTKAAIDGKLTRAQFFVAHGALLDSCQREHPIDDVKNGVFDLFDRDDNGIVDMMELVCGISLLCKGSQDDKVEAVFLMFDENGDGYVTVDEMSIFLQAVFKIVCTPTVMQVVQSVGVDVESTQDMASATTLECFQTADLSHEGKLSLEEFKKWFFAPRSNPELLFRPVKQMLN